MSTSGPILLAEDNPDDVLLIRLGFKKTGCEREIMVVPDGEQAVQYLKGEGKFEDRTKFPIPCLLLLDLKLPRLSGFDVLTWVRMRPEWKCLPVIVLTTSHYGKDIEQAYDLGANSFLTKPSDINEWMGAIEQIVRFWLHDSSLPEPGPFIPPPKSSSNLPAASHSTRTNRPASKSRRSNQSAATQKRKQRPSS